MTDKNDEQTVLKLITELCGTDEVLGEPDLDLFEAGILDSMGFVELLFALEEELGLVVPPTDVDRDEVSSVNKILAFVREER